MNKPILFKASFCFVIAALILSAARGQEPADNWREAELPPYIDVQIIPVGNVPLARFGKNAGVEQEVPPQEPGEEGAAENSTGQSTFSVITRPKDERPPRSFYVKKGGSYLMVNCRQNSIGTPVRIPVESPEIHFYSLENDGQAKEKFRKAFTHNLLPGQQRLLFTVTKPLAEDSWLNPIINTYDLSPAKLDDKSVVIINASSERYIIGVANQERFALAPYKMSAIPHDDAESLLVQVSGSSDKTNWAKVQKLSLPVMSTRTHLLLAYAVSQKESSRGFKVTRGKISAEDFREPIEFRPR